jgi:hypothetical protein
MAKLTQAQRDKLPSSAFLGPNRTFPAPDKTHAKLAESMANRSANAGNISQKTANKIHAKAARRYKRLNEK